MSFLISPYLTEFVRVIVVPAKFGSLFAPRNLVLGSVHIRTDYIYKSLFHLLYCRMSSWLFFCPYIMYIPNL